MMRLLAGMFMAVVIAFPGIAEGQIAARGAAPVCRASSGELLVAMDAVHRKQRNVGLSAAIMLDKKVVFTGNLGFADLEHRVPVTDSTRFGVASVTKAFTGVALLKAVAAGTIDLDAPIQRYVPEFPRKDGGEITARLLMAHLAGLRHRAGERTPDLYATHMTDVLEILPLFADDTLVGPPGHQYFYSSHGYNLLAMAIQRATGRSFQEYVRDEVLTPLRLTSTDFDNVQSVQPHRARRYSFYHPVTRAIDGETLYRVPEWDYSHNMGGGNIATTAVDLLRFGDALNSPGFLTASAHAPLFTPNATAHASSPWSVGFLYRPAGPMPRRISISGGNPGVQAVLQVEPEARLVVTVLSNTWGIDSGSIEMLTALPNRLGALCRGNS